MIYLDHNATTPVAPEVLEAMLPYLTTEWGNPSSSYRFGSKLKSRIEEARESVADLLGAHPLEILFTSCATESNNTAINSALLASPEKRHIVTSAVEHSAVLNNCRSLEGRGYRVTYLPVSSEGLLDLNQFRDALQKDTAVVSLMWANNETGVLFPVEEIAQICQEHGTPFHCDAVQVVGKLPIQLRTSAITYLSLTGHKFHAPKGIGALYVRKKTPFTPYLFGGHQERERRGGTESVPLIMGLARAAQIAAKSIIHYEQRIRPIRDSFEEAVLTAIPTAELNGDKINRIPNTTNISFHGIESEALLLMLDREEICASSGSACLADSDEPSHVIAAMKPRAGAAREMIRFSIGLETSKHMMKTALEMTVKAVKTLST